MNAKTLNRTVFYALVLAFLLPLLTSCNPQKSSKQTSGPVTIHYWEKWTSSEGVAIKKVVDDYNKEQNEIYVDLFIVSELQRKLLIATAGGDPPDVSGLWDQFVTTYASLGALQPLDQAMTENGVNPDDFLPVYMKTCRYQGKYYALPLTGLALGLHYNKTMFRKAGLDPSHGPRTLDELIEYNKKLTVRKKDGTIESFGFLPTNPGWWNYNWLYYTGGSLYDAVDYQIQTKTPENIRALQWFRDYAKSNGIQQMISFQSGFGNSGSPQNPFLSGKVAMELTGPWAYNFIQLYNPKLDWGVSPFPSSAPGKEGVTYVESDVIVIPQDSRHPKEAMKFITYLMSQRIQEKLNRLFGKFPMRKVVSPEFWSSQSNPYLKVYRDLAESPNAFHSAHIGIWQEFTDEADQTFQNVWMLNQTPEEALTILQKRMEPKWKRELTRMKRLNLQPE